MANDEPTEVSGLSVHDWRLSARIYKKPGHIHDVLQRFGPRRRSTLRKIIQGLDTMAIDYRIALKNRPPKFEVAHPILERFDNLLLNVKKQWLEEMRPFHQAIISRRIKMIPPSKRKQNADAAMASIDLDLAVTTLHWIVRKLRLPREYAAAHHQPGGRSLERAFLWEPLLRLMKKYHVEPGQYGSFLGATKALHLAIGIDPPSEGAVKKMRHDLRQGERPKQR